MSNPDLFTQYLVTGAHSDIGRELIQYLQNKGAYKILAVSRSVYNPSNTVYTDKVRYVDGIDLTITHDQAKLSQVINEFFDQPFTVIHSVGDFWEHKAIVKTQFPEVIQMMTSHYLALFGLAQVVIPKLISVGGGKIIAFSCSSVQHNYPEMAAFTSAKAALESLIRCIANEYSQHNIIANSIALSTILTPKVKKLKNPKYFDGYITTDELIKLVVDTVGEMSPLVNGNTIRLIKYSKYFYEEGYYQRNPSPVFEE